MKLLGATSGIMSLGGVATRLFAAQNPTGPLWLFVNAEGGWDTTQLFDPKGYNGPAGINDPARINNYDRNAIRKIGNIAFAPPPDAFLPGECCLTAVCIRWRLSYGNIMQDLL